MNSIDKAFYSLLEEIEGATEHELIAHIEKKYENIPLETQKSIEDFFEKFNYWGNLRREAGVLDEIVNKARALKRNISLYKEFYQELHDYRSKKTLFAILNN